MPAFPARLLVFVLCASSSFSPALSQTTYHVALCGDDSWSGLSAVCEAPDGPKRTIQAGMDAAVDGDTVLVAPGMYTGNGNRNIHFNGKAVVLKSANGPQETTIDVGNVQSAYAFHFAHGEGADSRLEGFTIRNPNAAAYRMSAIVILGASPVIADCVLIDCRNEGSSDAYGGAVFIEGGSPRFESCAFVNNVAYAEPGGGFAYSAGGAVYAANANLVFTDCEFENNRANDGGAIYARVNSRVELHRCLFHNNRASVSYSGSGGCGGAIYTTDMLAVGCSFTQNAIIFVDSEYEIGGLGGAIFASNSLLRDCAFIANEVRGFYAEGSAIRSTSTTVENCLFAGNIVRFCYEEPAVVASATRFRNCTFADNAVYPSHFVARANLFENSVIYGNLGHGGGTFRFNPTVRYSLVESGYTGEGNIDADPLFVDPTNGDYRIGAGSPCIDAADSTVVSLGIATDLAGEPRFRGDPATPDTGIGVARIVDMGAYEYQPHTNCPPDLNDDGTVNTIDVLTFLNAYGVQDPIADFNGDGVFNSLDFIAFLNAWSAAYANGGHCP